MAEKHTTPLIFRMLMLDGVSLRKRHYIFVGLLGLYFVPLLLTLLNII